MARGRVLVVDDEATSRTVLGERLRGAGYVVELAADGFKALGKVDDFRPDIVLTDLRMPGMDGLDFLRRVRARGEITVVMMTSFGGIDTAVAAMKEGAADYLTKPLNLTQLLLVVARELERLQLRRETKQLRTRLADHFTLRNVIGNSEPMQLVARAVSEAAEGQGSVLIMGEPGTGKDLIAKTIHETGARAARPLVVLACAGTGLALERDFPLRASEAEGGDLLLNDVGELGIASQSVLMRLINALPESADVRFLATSQNDLRTSAAEGRFREDLYERLAGTRITLPPLRDRREDVPLLAKHFLELSARTHGKSVRGLSDAALERLNNYHWPGNVRELAGAIERGLMLSTGVELGSSDLPPELQALANAPQGLRVPGATLEQIERWAITTTLEACGGATGKAARILGISARKIQYKLQQYESAPKGEAPVPVLDEEASETV